VVIDEPDPFIKLRKTLLKSIASASELPANDAALSTWPHPGTEQPRTTNPADTNRVLLVKVGNLFST